MKRGFPSENNLTKMMLLLKKTIMKRGFLNENNVSRISIFFDSIATPTKQEYPNIPAVNAP